MLKVAPRTTTVIQEGSVYKEKWVAPAGDPWPADATTSLEFLDSAGGQIVELVGAVENNGYWLTFQAPYDEVMYVPNGAGFRCYVHDDDGAHMARYGTLFRKQVFFPNSPANKADSYEPRKFTDTFQRPAGALGSRWKNVVGQARIFDNPGTTPNSVGPNSNFFSRYFTRYYAPFTGDSVELSISAIDKGNGGTVVAICSNSDCSKYLYAGFDSYRNKIEVGIGHGPDLGNILFPSGVLEPKVVPVSLDVSDTAPENFKVRYDDATRELGFYNDDFTTLYCSWADLDNEFPHGMGYRYMALGGTAAIIDSGVQVTYLSARDAA